MSCRFLSLSCKVRPADQGDQGVADEDGLDTCRFDT
jgi:hypothetical protein